MSNTARKIRRRRRHNLEKHWDLIATKAQLLPTIAIDEVLNNGFLAITSAGILTLTEVVAHAMLQGRSEATHSVWASEWVLQQMNLKPTSKSRERLRAALMRIRRQ